MRRGETLRFSVSNRRRVRRAVVDVRSAARALGTAGAGLSGFPSISAMVLHHSGPVMQADRGLLIDHLRVAFKPSILFKAPLKMDNMCLPAVSPPSRRQIPTNVQKTT